MNEQLLGSIPHILSIPYIRIGVTWLDSGQRNELQSANGETLRGMESFRLGSKIYFKLLEVNTWLDFSDLKQEWGAHGALVSYSVRFASLDGLAEHEPCFFSSRLFHSLVDQEGQVPAVGKTVLSGPK